MNKEMDERIRLKGELVRTIEAMGYPAEFGMVIADSLGTEKTLSRMIGYLKSAHPRSAEEIADEMLAIQSDRERWQQKKAAEYFNRKYNELLWFGLDTGEDPGPEEEE